METLADTPLSSSELRDAIFRLVKTEKDLSFRKKILNEVCCRALVSSAALRTVGEALITCWRDQSYSKLELSEWRTCLIEAADGPTKNSKGMSDVFMLYTKFAIEGAKWCAEMTAVAFHESSSQRDWLPEVFKVQKSVIRLTSTVFEAVAEVYLSGQTALIEDPFASTLESLTLNSFELVTIIYVCLMEKPSLQSVEDDTLRRRCEELLSVTCRLVIIFRRQVGGRLPEMDNNYQGENGPGSRSPALRIVASSIRSFAELGRLSLSIGERSLVLLNTSWKSILAFLQVEEGRDAIASVVDITSILVTLIANAVQATKRAIETWIGKSSDSGQKDARKLCIPIKFFLMTALKISSVYPQNAVKANRNMISCASKIYACLLHKDLIGHKGATEAFAEFVVPTAFALVQNLLNHGGVHEDFKVQILRDITVDSLELEISQAITDLDGCNEGNDIVDELFCNKPALRPGAQVVKTGKVVLFLSVLRASCHYSKTLLSELLVRLKWLLDEIPEEGMYVLMTQILYLPVDRSDLSGKWKWQLMFSWVSHAIQVFALVLAKQEPIWTEFQYFLFDQVLHPSVISGELVLNVWSFIIRQSDLEMARDHVGGLLYTLRNLVLIEEAQTLKRKLARTICVLLQAAPDSVASQICNINPFTSKEDADMITQLLQEGLPLDKPGWDNLLSSCIACGKGLVDSFKLEVHGLTANSIVQKQALTCLSLLISQSACRGECLYILEDKHLEEIKQIVFYLVSLYTLDHQKSRMFHDLGIIGPTLELIPHVQHLLDPTVFEALLPRILEICLTSHESSNSKELKQSLPEFVANLSDVAIPEDESNPAMKALRDLYHLVLREKSWALSHMSLQSFAYFAAHTSCQELWRFVPADAAVVSNGNGDDGFMTALKVFIEKECAILSLTSSGEELLLLRTEAKLQRQKHKITLSAILKQNDVEADGSQGVGIKSKSGKSEIQEAVAMLCKGIGVLKERAPEMLRSEASQGWEVLRVKLAEMNEQVKAFQRRDE